MKSLLTLILSIGCFLGTFALAQESDKSPEMEVTILADAEAASVASREAAIDSRNRYQQEQIKRVRRQFEEAVGAMAAAEGHAEAISRIAPYVSALSPQLELLSNNLTHAIQSKAGMGFIGIRMGESTDQGVLIDQIIEDSPAESGGLQEGDIVASVDGVQIREADDPVRALTALISVVEPGTTLNLEIIRDKRKLDKTLTTVSRRQYPEVWAYELDAPGRLSILNQVGSRLGELRDLRTLVLIEFESDLGHYFGEEFGVLVIEAPEGRELKKGDVLLRINDKPVRSFSHAKRFFSNSEKPAAVVVKRRGREQKFDFMSSDLNITQVGGA